MTKADIIHILAEGTGLTKVETSAVVDGFLATVAYALANNDRVELRNFGSFQTTSRKARNARNPRTGDIILIPEHKMPVFKASKELKKYINESKQNA